MNTFLANVVRGVCVGMVVGLPLLFGLIAQRGEYGYATLVVFQWLMFIALLAMSEDLRS